MNVIAIFEFWNKRIFDKNEKSFFQGMPWLNKDTSLFSVIRFRTFGISTHMDLLWPRNIFTSHMVVFLFFKLLLI